MLKKEGSRKKDVDEGGECPEKMLSQAGQLSIIGMIYKKIRPWLVEQAAKTETPIDDWMISVLDWLLLE